LEVTSTTRSPEILVHVTVVVAQAVGDDVGLTDIAAGVADCSFVVTEQQVDAGALNLVAL